MALVIENPLPAGFTRCPEAGCDCFSTWGLNPTGDPRVATALRHAVLDELRKHGYTN